MALGRSKTRSSTPARVLRALRIIALVAPKRGLVLPVIILPSLSSIAEAGALVIRAFSKHGPTALRSETEISLLCMMASILVTVVSGTFSFLTSSKAL